MAVMTTQQQKHVVAACYLGWTLDAFDFFIMAFVLDDVARAFHVTLAPVAFAITLTLACRMFGALIFGRLADRYGRRPVLMANVISYSVLEFASGFAPTLTVFLVLRALYGIAMGGEWGVGASLTMESIPPKWRGPVSGLLQAGYPSGYLLAAVLFLAEPAIGWRGMFMVGALPALLVLYIRSKVPESPDWERRAAMAAPPSILSVVRRNAGLCLYAVIMMMAFNFFSHGSQDLYPKAFLAGQHHLPGPTISLMVIIGNIGAMAGGILFGWLSQKIGRRWAILLAAALALPVLPLWAYSTTPAMLTAGFFLMQVCVQGAWGVVPVYLNELSPASIRGTFPGFVYQAGNFLASYNANLQVWLAGPSHDYAYALALVIGVVAVVLVVMMLFGRRTMQAGELGAAEAAE